MKSAFVAATPNPVLQRETTPTSTPPNSQPFAASDPSSATEETVPSTTAPSNTIEQPPIAPLNPVMMPPPPAPDPSPVTAPDHPHCPFDDPLVRVMHGYNETKGAGYQLVTGLCALLTMIHKACAFMTHAAADDNTHMFDY